MRILVVQHVPFEGPGHIADWARARGYPLTIMHPYAGMPWPALAALERLVLMGGPMSVHDEAEHPWLVGEKRLIADAIAAGKSVVGVCLGAQLIARTLGAAVRPNAQREIGWFPLELTAAARALPLCAAWPERLLAFHWHGDTFTLPPGALHVARSAACAQQAFLYAGRVLGLQCHLETTPASLAALHAHCGAELAAGGPFVQTAEELFAVGAAEYAALHRVLESVLDRLGAE